MQNGIKGRKGRLHQAHGLSAKERSYVVGTAGKGAESTFYYG